MKDANGVFLRCNPQFERFVGVAELEIVGKTDVDLFGKENADVFLESDRQATATGKPITAEGWRTFAADGYCGYFEAIKTPMRDQAGKPIGVLGIARDITERAQSLGLAVIAEGVETEAQRQFLERHGCPTYQGFLFSEPVDVAQFERLLA